MKKKKGKKKKIENKCCLQNRWQKGKKSLFLLKARPGLGPSPARGGFRAQWLVGCLCWSLWRGFHILSPGKLTQLGVEGGPSGARKLVRSPENKWPQIRSNPDPAERTSFPRLKIKIITEWTPGLSKSELITKLWQFFAVSEAKHFSASCQFTLGNNLNDYRLAVSLHSY